MTYSIALLAGDGIGPEILASTQCVLDQACKAQGIALAYKNIEIGFNALAATGSTFPDSVPEALEDCNGIILGPVSHNAYPPRTQGGLNPSGELRKTLDLYANIRPARSRAGIPPRANKPLDLVIVRENTEGFYADRNMASGPAEHMVTEDVAIALRRITRDACMRIARQAFALADQRRKRVTAVHKANVMRMTCGLFLECCRAVAADYPDVEYEEQLVDAMCALLVRAPEAYDVIVTTNMFGDILSDLASELSGSLGLAASLNAGTDKAMAQAQHGSAPDLAGLDVANPSALIGSSAMLMDWMASRHDDPRLHAIAANINNALEKVLTDPAKRTKDLGGPLGTRAFTHAVLAAL